MNVSRVSNVRAWMRLLTCAVHVFSQTSVNVFGDFPFDEASHALPSQSSWCAFPAKLWINHRRSDSENWKTSKSALSHYSQLLFVLSLSFFLYKQTWIYFKGPLEYNESFHLAKFPSDWHCSRWGDSLTKTCNGLPWGKCLIWDLNSPTLIRNMQCSL